MTQTQAKKLNLSLFVLYWKSGGSSIASVGQLHDGTRWFAPCNWTNESPTGIASTDWHRVELAVEIPIPDHIPTPSKQQAWRNYKRNQRKSIAALKKGDMLKVCRYVMLMDKWYLKS